uniref:Tudor domain-containing protein n=1 Tax=Panagrellus redivivus TaxID=6233 RepID=A0A7E4VZW8_PANRE
MSLTSDDSDDPVIVFESYGIEDDDNNAFIDPNLKSLYPAIRNRNIDFNEASNILNGFEKVDDALTLKTFPKHVNYDSAYFVDISGLNVDLIGYPDGWHWGNPIQKFRYYVYLRDQNGTITFGEISEPHEFGVTVSCQRYVSLTVGVSEPSLVRCVYTLYEDSAKPDRAVISYETLESIAPPSNAPILPSYDPANHIETSSFTLNLSSKQCFYKRHVILSHEPYTDDQVIEILLEKNLDKRVVSKGLPKQFHGRASFLVREKLLPPIRDVWNDGNGLWMRTSMTIQYFNHYGDTFVEITEAQMREEFRGICDFKIVQVIDENVDKQLRKSRKITRVDGNGSIRKLYPYAMLSYDYQTPQVININT